MKQESDKPFIKTRYLPDQLTREGDEKRGERMVTRGRGEERRGEERRGERERREEERRQDGDEKERRT